MVLLSFDGVQNKCHGMLKSKGLQFQYSDQVHFNFPDISCGGGESLLLLGGSGTGKTTWLHLLAGLRRPNEGSIEINGTDIATLTGSKLDRFRGEHIGVVFQTPHVVKSVSVLQNLTLANHMGGNSNDLAKAKDLLLRLGITDKASQKPNRLSAGQQQRVSIARAVMNQPKVLFADEPTSALDDTSATQVIDLLEEQAKSMNAALIIVTHDKRLKDRFPNRVEL